MKKRALISVFVKDGVLALAQFLHSQNWEILSTGGTAKYLTQNGVPVTDVSAVTGFPECLDGRVKTLHPKIHAGILAIRDNPAHMKAVAELGVEPIDLVCVNLYPFFEKVQAGLPFDETVEFIDIGGPTMIRAAAKNWQDVLVLTDPADYANAMAEIEAGKKDAVLHRRLAGKVFNLTSAYDAAVSRFMLNGLDDITDAGGAETFSSELPAYYDMPLVKAQTLRYGENAHQEAALYLTADKKGAFGGMEQLQGKELSYNNIRDLDVAWKAVSAFNRFAKNARSVSGTDYSSFDGAVCGKDAAGNKASPAGTAVTATFAAASASVFTVALKHNTPCGAALGATALESYKKTYDCDPVSIYGGIVGCSAVIDKSAAEEMVKCFLEVIVAPGFTDEALTVFSAKKNVRVVVARVPADEKWDCMAVDGGLLVQNRDNELFGKWDIVTKAKPVQRQIDEMAFGMTVAMFAKSNAILVVKDKMAIGIGCGQTNRIWAAEQALSRAKALTDAAGTSAAEVLISDAFFPFADCVEKAAEYGIKAIVQPGGSIRDQESIDACNKHGISMVFTGIRHFKH
ncbi:bifunctional phosphoribosylaminoimidazolecarboxamide formyltransferase/inosine monophosphate cyclohydrolase [Treponema brennaborense]|uniref:Bifunctional purine biosynthesis protein PurH n=1 Tax=Treponema brennaborense (strain DSM 12168 / CIP 105900 / DD5/3) TaxID=906968 RepID=F4LPI1_TREBD|nr:bifunctional phosphoribosylaminoimidazolecarboxamide formyltransferase/inosine monophosphate cyclohydrolase [Treponema brennaborense]AEE15992.1 Bifunctional purine biosynthesis protein purH [Treponema brennaborense DSM 12168]